MRAANVRVFMFGSIVGWAFVAVMVLTEWVNILEPPLWQRVLLYPGFVAGETLFEYCGSGLPGWWGGEWPPILVGILVVGLSYGVIALGSWRLVARRAS
jgi:hypothetical protein